MELNDVHVLFERVFGTAEGSHEVSRKIEMLLEHYTSIVIEKQNAIHKERYDIELAEYKESRLCSLVKKINEAAGVDGIFCSRTKLDESYDRYNTVGKQFGDLYRKMSDMLISIDDDNDKKLRSISITNGYKTKLRSNTKLLNAQLTALESEYQHVKSKFAELLIP
jgi:hypothetical protein